MRIKSGGGYDSNKLVTGKYGKQEPRSLAQNVDAVAQQGRTIDFNRKPLVAGQGYQPYGPKNHNVQGPGAGRTVYKSGSQNQWGPANPGSRDNAPDPSATGNRGRDIISEFGPERKR
jgi:hypothetical protein